RRLTKGDAAVVYDVKRTLAEWRTNDELADVREPGRDFKLPDTEMTQWQDLWSRIAAVSAGAAPETPKPLFPARGPKKLPDAILAARAHADKKEWVKAAERYGELLKTQAQIAGIDIAEIWFEYAAVQLLAEDRAGYRETCKLMLKAGRE